MCVVEMFTMLVAKERSWESFNVCTLAFVEMFTMLVAKERSWESFNVCRIIMV